MRDQRGKSSSTGDPAGWVGGSLYTLTPRLLPGWVHQVALCLASVTRLDNGIALVPVKKISVYDVVAPKFQVLPVGNKPVFVAADEKLGAVHADKSACYAVTSPKPVADCLKELLQAAPFA